ncbi:isochorismatase [Dolosicoccus paucivorans]|uniref:Isochorismatase n=1 Tax=Dolosicoccus paucivorans TaxID=84521 RepID=A0A2N6SN27_9LACT|nr:isochorismatase family protein [Dolosicoccus paucivorans]PMB84320.1 isochorismatase [Dolosicoccus paucivorans]PMC58471.1 isochorismatase [Dolosicoccus paucivorans]
MNKEDTLLLMIDLQERLVPVIDQKEEMIQESKKLLEGLKELDVPCIATEQYPKGLGPTLDSLASFFTDSHIYEKTQFSAYIDEVKSHLTPSIKHVIVIGAETHICVEQTIRDLLALNYTVHVPVSCVGSRRAEDKTVTLSQLQQEGVQLTTVESILFKLLKDAKNEHFKVISQLIK